VTARSTLPCRSLGATGVSVSTVAFGAMRLSEIPRPRDVVRALLNAWGNGVTIVDTARNYQGSERIIARALAEWSGPRPFLCTKVKPLDPTNFRFYVPLPDQFTPASMRASVELSLRELAVDCIDLLYLHQWYALWTHRPEWLDTFQALRAEGKIRFFGISAQDHEHDALLQIVDAGLVDAVQIVFNLFESRPLVSLLPLCAERGVGVVARCALDHSGALTGTRDADWLLARDFKLQHASRRVVEEYLARIRALDDDVARPAGLSLTELAIRFPLSHPAVATVALSMQEDGFLRSNLAAAARGPLPPEMMTRIAREHVWVKNFYYYTKSPPAL